MELAVGDAEICIMVIGTLDSDDSCERPMGVTNSEKFNVTVGGIVVDNEVLVDKEDVLSDELDKIDGFSVVLD